MRRIYRTTLPVTLSVSWYSTLVEEKDGDFYVKVKPHINRSGKAGANRVVQVKEKGGTKIIAEKQRNEDLTKRAEEKIKAIIAANKKQLKEDIVNGVNKALKGLPFGSDTYMPVNTKPAYKYNVSQEDIAAGASLSEQEQELRKNVDTSRWTKQQLEKIMKEKEEGEK